MDWMLIGTCALIVAARICDVSLGTLRTSMVVSGRKHLAFVLGFCEVLIWITVVSQIITNIEHWAYYIAYAFGFAAGNWIGITLEQRLAFGTQVVQVFSRKAHEVATALRAMSLGEALPHIAVTEMEAKGHKGPVGVLFAEVPRKFASAVAGRVVQVDPEAYFVIEDVRRASSAASRQSAKTWPLFGLIERK